MPPEVITYPSGYMNVTLGGIFQITCEPKGVPYPMVSWLHNGRAVTNTDNGNRRLTVEVKHYDMSGPIECVADNGVGQPAMSGIVMLVHCKNYLNFTLSFPLLRNNFSVKPEVKVKIPVVHTKVGDLTIIECNVLSYPTARVHWFHNGKPVLKSHIIVFKENDLVRKKLIFIRKTLNQNLKVEFKF